MPVFRSRHPDLNAFIADVVYQTSDEINKVRLPPIEPFVLILSQLAYDREWFRRSLLRYRMIRSRHRSRSNISSLISNTSSIR